MDCKHDWEVEAFGERWICRKCHIMTRKDSKGILHYTDVDGNIVYVSCDDSMADIEAYVNAQVEERKREERYKR